MCGLTSQVLARDSKAGGHPDLISAAKLLQRILALAITDNYCQLLSIRVLVYSRKIHIYRWLRANKNIFADAVV